MTIYLTVTAKGQVTLRKELLEHLGVAPGDRIAVETLPSGKVSISASKRSGTMEDFIGCLERPCQRTVSLEELSEAAAAGWAGER